MDRVIYAYGSMGQLDFTLFRPFNWIGAGLDSIHTPKEGSSRVITQFLGHIVRGEPIKLVDGGAQKRAFTYIDDGIAALMKIIENRDGVASGRIYNIGNPKNNYLGARAGGDDAGAGEDLPRVPRQRREGEARRDQRARSTTARATRTCRTACRRSTNTMQDLGWEPKVDMETALRAHLRRLPRPARRRPRARGAKTSSHSEVARR